MVRDGVLIGAVLHVFHLLVQMSVFVPVYVVLGIRLSSSTTVIEATLNGFGGNVVLPLASIGLLLLAALSTAAFYLAIRTRRRVGGTFREVEVERVIYRPLLGVFAITAVGLVLPLSAALSVVAVTIAAAPLVGDDFIRTNALVWVFGYVPYRVKEQQGYSSRVLLAERGSLHEALDVDSDEATQVMVTTANGRQTYIDGRYTYSKELGYTPLPTTRKLLRRVGRETHPKQLNSSDE